MTPTVALLATLDTKGQETAFLREQVEAQGARALLLDLGVVAAPTVEPDLSREEIAAAGGTPLAELLENPTRQEAAPVMVRGASSSQRGSRVRVSSSEPESSAIALLAAASSISDDSLDNRSRARSSALW